MKDCPSSVDKPGYCNEHVCAADRVESIGPCVNVKGFKFDDTLNNLRYSEYCPLHTCSRKYPPCYAFNDNRVFCKSHRCLEKGCDHGRLIDEVATHTSNSLEFCKCHNENAFRARIRENEEQQRNNADQQSSQQAFVMPGNWLP